MKRESATPHKSCLRNLALIGLGVKIATKSGKRQTVSGFIGR